MNHKGTNTIETEGLILRRFQLDDAQMMFENWANDPEVTKYLSWNAVSSVEEVKTTIERWMKLNENLDNYHWAIVEKASNQVIGSITKVDAMDRNLRAEIGYCISRKYWGKGITVEALKAVIDYLFSVGYSRIQATHSELNINSGKVLLKAGMTYEGKLSKYVVDNKGELQNHLMYSILK